MNNLVTFEILPTPTLEFTIQAAFVEGVGKDLTDEEILQSLIAANVLSAVTSGGAILTDENHNILMM